MAGLEVVVRRASHRDFDAIAGLMQGLAAQNHLWHPDQFRTALLGFTAAVFQGWLERRNELHLAAEVEGSVAGYACATRWEGGTGDLTWGRRGVYVPFVVVGREQRRKGVGRAMFAAIEAWAQEYEAEYIGLNVSTHNEAAQAVYEALGYDVSSEYRVKTLRTVKRIQTPPLVS